MSEDCGIDIDWWKAYESPKLSRRPRSVSSSALAQPGDSFLIVTEGTVTEPVYFELIRRELELSVVRIKVQPGKHSDPSQVIETAAREAKVQVSKARTGKLRMDEPEKFDHVFAVIDTDVAVQRSDWNKVRKLAADSKVLLAPSTPCFEFWLLLHRGFTTKPLSDGETAKKELKQSLGREYSTSERVTRAALASLLPSWPQAVMNAEQVTRHHEQVATAPPANPSTDVGRLVRALNDSAPAHMRKLRGR